MCREARGSQLVDRVADEALEVLRQRWIGLAVGKLVAQPIAREPARASAVGHDVGHGLAAIRERHVLACLDRGDDFGCPVPQVADADLHVLQRSTTVLRWAVRRGLKRCGMNPALVPFWYEQADRGSPA